MDVPVLTVNRVLLEHLVKGVIPGNRGILGEMVYPD